MVTDIAQLVRSQPQTLSQQKLIEEAVSRGAVNAKVILTHTITLGNWTRLKCQFGCPEFGKRFTCPTFTPSTQEMSDILRDYENAIVVEAKDSASVHGLVLGIESFLRQKGYSKAFGIGALPCDLCEVCTVDTHCEHPQEARPTLQGCSIDVFQTMSNIGWKLVAGQEPCSEHQTVGIILID